MVLQDPFLFTGFERKALHLMTKAMGGDTEARLELEALPNRDEIMNGLVACYLAGPMDGGVSYDETLDASL